MKEQRFEKVSKSRNINVVDGFWLGFIVGATLLWTTYFQDSKWFIAWLFFIIINYGLYILVDYCTREVYWRRIK
jgi:hypothetical protein